MKQLVLGIQGIHHHEILYRNLSPDTVTINWNSQKLESVSVKFSNFSNAINQTQIKGVTEVVFPFYPRPGYTAPELL